MPARRDINIFLGAAGALSLHAAPASAEVGYLSPGVIGTFMAGHAPANAIGAELSYMYYASGPTKSIGLGAFAQASAYDLDHPRLALGFQAGSFLGVEIGFAYRGPDDRHTPTFGAHLGLYGSLGVLVVGLRGTVPIVSGQERGKDPQGGEIGLVLGLKFPIKVHGSDSLFSVPHGRPLRQGDTLRVAEPVIGSAWGEGPEPLVGELDAITRRALGEAWLRDALEEHAAVGAFAQLAFSLLALGAPADLLSRTQQAAAQEVEHARLCFSLASVYLGTPIGPGPLAVGAVDPPDLVKLALESWRDGCLGEGASAAVARAARRRAHDPAVCAALSVISRDEAAHAELGWDVIDLCLERGGRPVADALRDEVARTPKVPEVEGDNPGPALAALLAEHGQLSASDCGRCVAEATRTAVRRAGWLLAPGARSGSPSPGG